MGDWLPVVHFFPIDLQPARSSPYGWAGAVLVESHLSAALQDLQKALQLHRHGNSHGTPVQGHQGMVMAGVGHQGLTVPILEWWSLVHTLILA